MSAPRLKNQRLVVAAAFIFVAVLVAALTYQPKEQSAAKCGPYRHDKTVSIDSTQFQTEVASSAAERAKGLGSRPCIEQNQAMLFVFDKPGHYAFWMKDMRFPIDIVWISSEHRVVGLEIAVSPSTYPDRFVNRDNPALYVLELQANRAKNLNINLGTPVNF